MSETTRPTALVVTTIARPNKAMRKLAKYARQEGWRFYVIGDTKTPPDYTLSGAEYWSVEAQRGAGLAFGRACPERHYSRKNIGYLLSARDGAEVLIETDDDNLPEPLFTIPRRRQVVALSLAGCGWVNIYRYFTSAHIWPRGFPLDAVLAEPPEILDDLAVLECPIQQGLADENPDVDAIFRLVLPLPVSFEAAQPIALKRGAWCPFNSQNTTWFREAFPLLYLPVTCNMRLTDIWRGLVAQRVAWEYGWPILFHQATVRQKRNEHHLMKDFEDELPGYLRNRRIAEILGRLRLSHRAGSVHKNMEKCYQALVAEGILDTSELKYLEAWRSDCSALNLT
jgi:hypothetical protein